ncbi:MAG: hypothetical protein MUE52_11855 [Tabrizicola sp.]|jgi:hypothetical protein|nr:hypothetical protein [Tabrizicola sp.]
MHGVNLDLLKTTAYRADGTPRDPHAHHRAAHLATLRVARRARWASVLVRIATRLAHPWRSSMTSSLRAGDCDEKTKSNEELLLTPLRP